jgi:hypothetical protein
MIYIKLSYNSRQSIGLMTRIQRALGSGEEGQQRMKRIVATTDGHRQPFPTELPAKKVFVKFPRSFAKPKSKLRLGGG